jgi:hypothetical protein
VASAFNKCIPAEVRLKQHLKRRHPILFYERREAAGGRRQQEKYSGNSSLHEIFMFMKFIINLKISLASNSS